MDVELVCDRVRRAAASLASLDITDLDADAVRRVMRELGVERAHSSQLQLALAARATELHDDGGSDDPVDLLAGVGAMPRREAQRVIRHSELLARMPALAAALKDGRISDGHLEVVASARRRIDPNVRDRFDAAHDAIATHATERTPDGLADWLRFMARRLERDHTRDRDLRAKRAVRVAKWIDKEGVYQLHGSFDPEMGARLFTAIDTAVETLRKSPAAVVPGDDPKDPLGSEGELLAAHALARLVSHGHAAAHPGLAEIVVLVDERTLSHGYHDESICELHDGSPVHPDFVRRLCCEAMLTAVVVSADGTIPLNAGRTIRTANREQRRALRAIHRTCAVDGCTTPFDWCEIHHLWFWELGGPTDIDNLVPLCLRHHHLVHDAAWRLSMQASDRTLTLLRPDGTVYREMRPPGLRSPADVSGVPEPPGVSSTTAA